MVINTNISAVLHRTITEINSSHRSLRLNHHNAHTHARTHAHTHTHFMPTLSLVPLSSPADASTCTPCPLPGDQRHRAGLPAAPAPGLPHPPAPADAGLLAEGAHLAAPLRRHRQRPGQADPEPRLPEDSGPGRSRVSGPSVCPSERRR